MDKIDHKVVWITGASSGIGEGLVYALSKKDCKLLISSRNTEALQLVKERCAYSDSVHIIPLDLAAYEEMDVKVEEALEHFGTVDILINNAGISQRSLIADTRIAVFKKLMDINYLGTVALTKALLPHFISQQKGHYVTVTSLMGKFGSPYRSGYCGAKHALHGFFDVLRMEHEQDGINVSLVCPGFVQTNVAKNALIADGNTQKSQDEATENGLSVAIFVKKMIHAIERKKFEVYIGGGEVKGIYLKRFLPKLLHKVVLRSKVT